MPAFPVLPNPARLAMLTGAVNLLWATVTVLMILRPGPQECDPIATDTTATASGRRSPRRALRVSGTVELVSLAVLLANIATGDNQQIAALFGPVHGGAWLFGVLAAWRDPRRSPRAAMLAVLPGVGGLLALRALDRADARSAAAHVSVRTGRLGPSE